MVGGSGLYIDAICKGFDKMPDISEEIRNKVISLYKKKGIEFLQSELKENDLIYFNEVDIQNPQRLMRALEVIYSTGKKFSYFREEQVKKRSFNIMKIALVTNKDLHHKFWITELYEKYDISLIGATLLLACLAKYL